MRVRLDTQLVDRGLVPSREKAKRLILAGAVRVDGQLAAKASDMVEENARLELLASEKYVSRGGHKLEAALDAFHISCENAVCADIGASTGGFTDCLLQRGAQRVHAVDVGTGQLDWKLRQDARVRIHDGVNARNMTAELLGEEMDLVTIDVSFISLRKVLPAAVKLLRKGGHLVALIKPQFEAGRQFVEKGGVVRDGTVHDRVQAEVAHFATDELGLRLIGFAASPLLGPAGNREFFIGLTAP
jgi:23S rRNA (cytidine1920-2'-O)/16S rRNA (cytidine1409-2'-O)-methyltransferase